MNKEEFLLESNRVGIRKIKYSDTADFNQWESFKEEELLGYNYSRFTQFESTLWYNYIKSLRKRYFSIITPKDNRFIGFIGLKNIDRFKASSYLGLVFDPKYVSQGYGFEAMRLFLPYYFNQLKFKTMLLTVNSFNDRAIRLYEKLHFKVISESFEKFENQNIEATKPHFFKIGETVYSNILEMRLDRDEL